MKIVSGTEQGNDPPASWSEDLLDPTSLYHASGRIKDEFRHLGLLVSSA
jgi:hypothetical protein